MNTIFITKTVFFVGTSLTDPEIALIFKTVNKFTGEGLHFVLLSEKEADTEVMHWQNFFGIQIIQYRVKRTMKKVRDSINIHVVV